MESITAVFIIVAHFTVMGYGGDALPEGKRVAFANVEDCLKGIPAVRRSFERSGMPISPDNVSCHKLEIRK